MKHEHVQLRPVIDVPIRGYTVAYQPYDYDNGYSISAECTDGQRYGMRIDAVRIRHIGLKELREVKERLLHAVHQSLSNANKT